jgi:hypothetical protein
MYEQVTTLHWLPVRAACVRASGRAAVAWRWAAEPASKEGKEAFEEARRAAKPQRATRPDSHMKYCLKDGTEEGRSPPS